MYAGLMWAVTRLPAVPANLGYLVPALAVIIAARGAAPGRKAAFALGSLAILMLVDLAAAAGGLQAAAVVASADLAQASATGLGAAIVYHVLSIGFPVVVVVAFVGRRASMLWEAIDS